MVRHFMGSADVATFERREAQKRDRAYGGVRSFAPRGRSSATLYAVALREHPGVVKVGRTRNWRSRRHHYANWNLSSGGIERAAVFVITEEYIDLEAAEAALLRSIPLPLRHGREWLVGDFDDVARRIGAFLDGHSLSHLIEFE